MKKKSAGSVAIMLLVMIYLLIPLVISIIYSVFHKWTGVIPEGFGPVYGQQFPCICWTIYRNEYYSDYCDDRDRPSGIICNGDLFSET